MGKNSNVSDTLNGGMKMNVSQQREKCSPPRNQRAEARVVIGTFFVLVSFLGCASTQKHGEGVDFITRCSSPDVVRCVSFDRAEEVDPYVYPPWGKKEKLAKVDSLIKASGNGSLRFEIRPFSSGDTSGKFMLNFSDDFTLQFGEGEEFFIQWRQRFSEDFLDTHFHRGVGWKQVIIGEGDLSEHKRAPGCSQMQLVVHNRSQRGFASMYHACGKFENLGGGAPYYPDEWMTFQVHVKIGTWYKKDGNYSDDSTVQFWVAREGEESELVVDLTPESTQVFGVNIPGSGSGYNLVNTNPNAKYGKIYLTPYHTRKSPKQDHPTFYTWYDELIISKRRIADPLN